MILSVSGLRKSFGPLIAVDDIAFDVELGEIVGLAGPNGSGKSALLRILAGAMEPQFGAVRLLGFDALLERRRAQQKLGFVPEGAPLPEDGTPVRLLRRAALLRGLRDPEARHAVLAAATAAQLDAAFDRPIESLSPGQRRRLAIAAALVHKPVLLLFDELDEGLDWQEREVIRQVVRAVAVDRAVVLASRSLDELQAVCDRVLMLYRGRIVGERASGKDENLAQPYAMLMAQRRLAR